MKRRRIILIILLALLAPAGFIVYLTHSNEPSYQGKTLTEWLNEYNDRGGTFLSDEAPEITNSLRAIKAIGTNGIPTLIKLLQSRDIKGSAELQSFVQRLGWETFHIHLAREKWDLAQLGFSILGGEAEFAAPMLADLLKSCPLEADPDILYSLAPDILLCLENIQSPKEVALPIFIQQLNNTNNYLKLRLTAAYCLRDLYPDEVEKAGVYEMFPAFDPPSTTTPPAATK